MTGRTDKFNIVSVSWPDHLCFGEGDGRLDTLDAVKNRLAHWRDDLQADTIHWRLIRTHIKGRFYEDGDCYHPTRIQFRKINWNDLDVVPELAHKAGLKIFLYVSLFDEGWPLAPAKERRVSFHNAMHGQHVSWQSDFSRNHPEFVVVDRAGKKRQWGVMCLAYPEVRQHFCKRFVGLLKDREFDGLFVCFRSQSKPADFADQYGFNEPVRDDFLLRYNRDILNEDFDLPLWRDLPGEYISMFLRELRQLLPDHILFSVGVARGEVLGPSLGNATLHWREWIKEKLIGQLIINQNSSQCPSMWHQLWPMHRGYGYLQNYLDGYHIPPLIQHLSSIYQPVLSRKSTKLFIARQWDERSEIEERKLLQHPSVDGLVFSSFRHDNPVPVKRNDWRPSCAGT